MKLKTGGILQSRRVCFRQAGNRERGLEIRPDTMIVVATIAEKKPAGIEFFRVKKCCDFREWPYGTQRWTATRSSVLPSLNR